MVVATEPTSKNLLLRNMSPADWASVWPLLEPCELPIKLDLERVECPITYVYFPESGIASIVARSLSGKTAEVGLVGLEGMTGAAILLGGDVAIHDCYVQVPGAGRRMTALDLSKALEARPTLRTYLLRHISNLLEQTAYTALTNARFSLEERLARWILMCDDRIVGNKVSITHEFLSIMLGVRRPGVTTALHMLEGRQLVRASRGVILIRDRDGLVAAADGSYRTMSPGSSMSSDPREAMTAAKPIPQR